MNDLTLFLFEKTEIRAITDERGEPWFVLRDVLDALDRKGSRTNEAVASITVGLGEGYVETVPLQTKGGLQTVVIVSEPAVTFLVSRSNTETGRKLNRFIHADVLPKIRKTGQYIAPKTPGEALVEMAQNFLRHEREIMALQHQQAETAAQVKALVDGEDYYTIVGYANLIGEKVDAQRSSKLGKIATRICAANGWHLGSAPHPSYGSINSYPRQAVALAFDQETAV